MNTTPPPKKLPLILTKSKLYELLGCVMPNGRVNISLFKDKILPDIEKGLQKQSLSWTKLKHDRRFSVSDTDKIYTILKEPPFLFELDELHEILSKP